MNAFLSAAIAVSPTAVREPDFGFENECTAGIGVQHVDGYYFQETGEQRGGPYDSEAAHGTIGGAAIAFALNAGEGNGGISNIFITAIESQQTSEQNMGVKHAAEPAAQAAELAIRSAIAAQGVPVPDKIDRQAWVSGRVTDSPVVPPTWNVLAKGEYGVVVISVTGPVDECDAAIADMIDPR